MTGAQQISLRLFHTSFVSAERQSRTDVVRRGPTRVLGNFLFDGDNLGYGTHVDPGWGTLQSGNKFDS